MRLLIVNPNTSEGVTARIAAAADAVALPGDSFVTVSAASGPSLILTEADGLAATEGVLTAVARRAGGVDGIVLASFGDTGAESLRLRYPALPILGIAEAALAAARDIGGRFAIVTFAPEVVPSLHDIAERHGMTDRLLRIATVPHSLTHDPADVADLLFDDLRDLSLACAAEGADSIVMGGGPLAGVAVRIAPHCAAPVIDGTQAAIARLRLHAGIGAASRA